MWDNVSFHRQKHAHMLHSNYKAILLLSGEHLGQAVQYTRIYICISYNQSKEGLVSKYIA